MNTMKDIWESLPKVDSSMVGEGTTHYLETSTATFPCAGTDAFGRKFVVIPATLHWPKEWLEEGDKPTALRHVILFQRYSDDDRLWVVSRPVNPRQLALDGVRPNIEYIEGILTKKVISMTSVDGQLVFHPQ